MTTVWVITSGSYSEYNVNGVFSTKTKAEAFCKLRKEACDDFNDPEEFELDSLELGPDMVVKEVMGTAEAWVPRTKSEQVRYDENLEQYNKNQRRTVRNSYFAEETIFVSGVRDPERGTVYSRVPDFQSKLIVPKSKTCDVQVLCGENIIVTSFVSKEHAHKVCAEKLQEIVASRAILGN